MKKALLTVSFGTSHLDTLEKNIAAIERDLAAALPDRTPRRAFTSGMIMKKLRQRDGIVIPNVDEVLAQLAEEGFEDVLIQPTHVINGEEYDKLCAQARPYEERFARLRLGTPLLTDAEDYRALAQAVLPTLPEKRGDTSVVFMGHGSEHHANAVYAMLDYLFRDLGREDIHIGTVEGYPGLDEVRRRINDRGGVSRVLLLPLMIVAGDHAKNDLAGDEDDSWKSIFQKAGYDVQCVLSGLGENPAVREIFAHHARRAAEA